ncbi:interferon-inducible GTPase 5-like [Pseudochaenichthys georgianus]|uniref:interferon-inducible GTPase 5-like n=1 Tax=Pseudochaenichthys georgianus TaxID=52239 RepID=UPI00146A2350|nr:interferon-inducible GTPase 5-like [Pseudochaenichthys georgianus]
MEDPFEKEQIEQIRLELETNGAAAAAAKIGACLAEQDNIPLNIGVTGACGSGKSTFVNAFRGSDKKDKGAAAAPTGCTETTVEVKPYPHPKYPNVTLWDLPGVGTPNFQAEDYLNLVQFDRFDFFVIISAERFRQHDVELAKEIQRMGKKFYFVRSKIDQDMRNEEETVSDFNAENVLTKIRNNCIQGLEKEDVESPKVVLVSSHHLHLYDFCKLQETLERELPAHKRAALLLALPIVNLQIIKKKKEALQSHIKFLAAGSAVAAAVPVPLLSGAVDLSILVKNAVKCKNTFGLDRKSLQSLADSTRVPLEDLIAEMKSPLALKDISREVILNMLRVSWFHGVLMAAEEGSRFVPFLGLPAAAALSFASTYKALSTFLDMLAEDAQRVFIKALGLHTSV